MAKKDIIKKRRGEVIKEAKIEGENNKKIDFHYPQYLWIIGFIVLFICIILLF